MTFLGHLGGPWETLVDFCRAVVRVYCELVLLAEHWRLLGAAAGDSGWPEWTG